MIQEILAAFAVGFLAGLVYESQRVTRVVKTDRGLVDFLMVHAPWHVKMFTGKEPDKRPVRKSPISLIIKIVSLGTIILLILLTSGLF